MLKNDFNLLDDINQEPVDFGNIDLDYLEEQLGEKETNDSSVLEPYLLKNEMVLKNTKKVTDILSRSGNLDQFLDVFTMIEVGEIDFEVLDALVLSQTRILSILKFKPRLIDLYFGDDENGKESFRLENDLKIPVGEYLLKKGLITQELLNKALLLKEQNKKMLLGKIILKLIKDESKSKLILLELIKIGFLRDKVFHIGDLYM